MPDLYAAFLLPSVLAGFARVYPQVEIELRCSRSHQLRAALTREEIDLALMTKQPDQEGGVIVREEPSSGWQRGTSTSIRLTPPPGTAAAGSLYRQCALDALGQTDRSWTITAVSDSIAGLQAAVHAGLAVSIFPQCAVDGEIRRLTTSSGLPDLPALKIVLQRKAGEISCAVDHLAQYILSELGNIGG